MPFTRNDLKPIEKKSMSRKCLLFTFVLMVLFGGVYALDQRMQITPAFYEIVKNPPEWMVSSIERDFAYFKEKECSNVDTLMEYLKETGVSQGHHIVRYHINKKVISKSYSLGSFHLKKREKVLEKALINLQTFIDLPDDLDFVLNLDDFCSLLNVPAPILTLNKLKNNVFTPNIPDIDILSGLTSNHIAQVQSAIASSPWDSKKDTAFFRGSTTGYYGDKEWQLSARAQLVLYSMKSSLVDAKFTDLVQGAETNLDMLEFLNTHQLIGDHISPKDSINYRYLIVMDGNANTGRTNWTLSSNCAVLIQDGSPYTMWWHAVLKPFVHYIPFNYDSSNLIEMIEWARSHQEKAKIIAENGRQLVLNELTLDHMYAYLYLVLKEYYSLTNHSKTKKALDNNVSSNNLDKKIIVFSPFGYPKLKLETISIKELSHLDRELVLAHANKQKSKKSFQWDIPRQLVVLKKDKKFRVYKVGAGREPALFSSENYAKTIKFLNEYNYGL